VGGWVSGAEETLLPPVRDAAAGTAAVVPRRRLFRKYTLLFIALVGAALLISSGVGFWFSYQENKAALVGIQQEKAQAAAARIEEFVGEIQRQIGWTTHAQWAAGPLDQRRQDYFRLQRQVPAITELTQLDDKGREQLTVSRLKMDVVAGGADWAQNPAFTGAKAQKVWFSPVYFRKESEPYMTVAVAHDGRNAGVTIAEINLKLIWDVITALKIGQQGYAFVVDGRGRLIAHPDISLVLRDTDLASLPQVAEALASTAPAAAPSATVARNIGGHRVLTAHAAIQPVGWRVFVEVPLAEAFAPLYGAAWRTAILLGLGLVAAVLVALTLARRMTGPIRAIAAGAERIGQGELGRRIEIDTGDELEALAEQFNRMGDDLQKSYAELEQRVTDRTAELSEALDQQTATAEVLGVINSSPGDLVPVFDAMLEKALNLCEAAFGILWTYDGECLSAVASRGVPPAFTDFLATYQDRATGPGFAPAHASLLKGDDLVHIPDVASDEEGGADHPVRRAAIDLGGARSLLVVGLRKERTMLGILAIYRQEVRPFGDKQIALLQNFAAQAVIAMENARLITETREALDQQTATAEVLGVINSSPGDLAPVFDAMLEKATTLCDAHSGFLWTYDGERFRAAATRGLPPPFDEFLREPRIPGPETGIGRLVRGESLVQFEDLAAIDSYQSGDELHRASVDLGGFRTVLVVPLRKDGNLLGGFTIERQQVRPFTDKQIALLQNFAAQAVIAMENARLITETREALDQQTATAEVLGVINSSPGDLAPVFDAMLEKATSLCEAGFGSLLTFDGERFHAAAFHRVPPAFAEFLRQPLDPGAGGALTRIVRERRVVQVEDALQTEAYRARTPLAVAGVELGGMRTLVVVPLLKEDTLLGALHLYRREARPFADKQIALLQNFAAQAVIAMENARLITETREALDQQTATAEVLGVINSSPGDLAPVFDAMLEKALNLCGASFGGMRTYDGERFHPVAERGGTPAWADFWRSFTTPPSPVSGLGRVTRGERIVHIIDIADDDAYRLGDPWRVATVELLGARTCIWVALRKDDRLLGVLYAYRREIRPFTDKQIALLQNFAAQAVIAMENARLITETREALEQQTATAEVLGVINSSPGDLQPVLGAMVERAIRLCEAASAVVRTFDNGFLHLVAASGAQPAYERAELLGPVPLAGLFEPFGRGETIVHIADVRESATYRDIPAARERLNLRGIRTWLAVALSKENTLLGTMIVSRQEVRPFSEKQIALLQNFAAQAVIAMENARLITETREALEQQTATAEVLGVINSSPGDLTPVFDAMLEKAMRLCTAAFGYLMTFDGERFVPVAHQGLPRPFAEYLSRLDQPGSSGAYARIRGGAPLVQIDDLMEGDVYRTSPLRQALVDLGGARTGLIVALRKDELLLGVFTIYRQEVRPFSEKEIALLQNFAAQAVIAMENARLITETREALEQQTATAEVLGVINSSPGDLAPVFDAIIEKAMRLCETAFGFLDTYDGATFQTAAERNVPAAFAEHRQRHHPQFGLGTAPYRFLHGERRAIETADLMAEAPYRDGDQRRRALVDLGGARSALSVPLYKEDSLLGYITVFRQEVRPFSDKQIALLENFAAQAVIAMENARLLGELRGRTRDLQESLEYQTATSDVLKVISQSAGEIEPVLNTLLETGALLCQAEQAIIALRDPEDGRYHYATSFGYSADFKDLLVNNPVAPGRGALIGRTALERHVVHIEDAASDPEYTWAAALQTGRWRTGLGVPLLREGSVIGVLALTRTRVERFTEKQIELVRTFADQAVIAIENARLLNELRERTDELGRSVEELKALGEVGQEVSSTLDLHRVLVTILNRSVDLGGADAGVIFRYSRAERSFHFVEAVGWSEERVRDVRRLNVAEAVTALGEAIARRAPLQIPDLRERPSNPLRDGAVADGYRSVLIVPLVGGDRIMGTTILYRRVVGEFPEPTIRLMQTLASQSVLAIQNARLFREIAEKSEQLAEASRHKSQFLANMSHELRTPLNAILGYAELLVDGIYGAVPERAMGVLERVQNNGKHLLALINDVLDLSKIEAGQLVLTVEDYAMPDVVHSVVSATEGLASTKGLAFTADIAPGLPTGRGDARRLAQVLLNLTGNAIKFTDQGEVAIRAAAENGNFILTVRDTGPGIAPEDHDKIFEEFQQVDSSNTRKKGGTGLGLAISRRMVELQGGTIAVESALGHGATFRVTLPIRVEELAAELMGAAE
jgi:GAF domain-containing protein/anti-sigma regulatory factor (Ser/Thr protein kinase)